MVYIIIHFKPLGFKDANECAQTRDKFNQSPKNALRKYQKFRCKIMAFH